MLAHELLMRSDDAAEVLRPRSIESATDDDVTYLLLAQFLRIRRKAHECIDLAVCEQLHRLGRRVDNEIDIPLGINADVGRHGGNEDMVCRSQFGDSHHLSLEIANRPYALGPEQLVHFEIDARPVLVDDVLEGLVDMEQAEDLAELGSDSVRSGAILVARLDASASVRPDEPIELVVNLRHLHFFDPVSCEAIGA